MLSIPKYQTKLKFGQSNKSTNEEQPIRKEHEIVASIKNTIGANKNSDYRSDLAPHQSLTPNQPIRDCYPVTDGRKFQATWYKLYPWLEYSLALNRAFCFPCRLFNKKEIKNESALIRVGYNNWKQAPTRLREHQNSPEHQAAEVALGRKINNKESCSTMLNCNHSKHVEKNRRFLKFIFETVFFLAKQTIEFRGHFESCTSSNQGNFFELLQLRVKDAPELSSYVNKNKYSSPEIQNEIINIIGKI